jgi:AraC family transcriptional regulator
LQELDAVPGMASVIHQGEYATLPQTSAALYGWTQANGLQATGPIREIYLPADGVSTPPIADTYTGCIEVQCPVEPAYIPLSIQPGLISNQGDTKTMEPEIKNRPAFKAVGLSYVGKNEHGEIPQLWDRFNPRFHEPKNINSVECFGLCISNLKDAQPGEFEYVACVEVADDRDIPDGMVCREVPAYKYAVFTHHGKLDTLGETYQYIYNTWLPQSGMELNPDKFDMEVYTDEFILGDDKSKFYIWVALA